MIYGFIFYFIYKLFDNTGESSKKWIASIGLAAAQFIHFCFILALIKAFFFLDSPMALSIFDFRRPLLHGRVYLVWALLFPLTVVIFRYYKPERLDKLSSRYRDTPVLTLINTIKIISLILLPFITLIILISIISKSPGLSLRDTHKPIELTNLNVLQQPDRHEAINNCDISFSNDNTNAS